MTVDLNKGIKLWLKLLLGIVVIWFVFRQLDLKQCFSLYQKIANSRKSVGIIAFVFLLLFINWGIEGKKWKLLVQTVQPIHFIRALFSVFSGVTVSLFTPNRMGSFLGRMIYVDEPNRKSVVGLSVIASFSQLLVTIVFGLFAAVFYMHFTGVVSIIFLLVLLAALLIVYFMLPELVHRFRWNSLQWLKDFVIFFEGFNRKLQLQLLLWSTLRYLVFATQMVLCLFIFDSTLPLTQLYVLVALVYLISTLVPSVALIEFGIRGAVAIYLFNFFGVSAEPVVSAYVLIWVINLVIPAIIGTLLPLAVK